MFSAIKFGEKVLLNAFIRCFGFYFAVLCVFVSVFIGVNGFLLSDCALMCLLLFLFQIIMHKLAKIGSFSYYCVVIDINLGLEPPVMENY